jgi:hypothetical protein
MDACPAPSRQSGHDTATPAVDCRQALRPLRAVCVDAQVCLRPHTDRAAPDAGGIGELGCGIGGGGPTVAVLEMRDAQVQRYRAAGDETGWLGQERSVTSRSDGGNAWVRGLVARLA